MADYHIEAPKESHEAIVTMQINAPRDLVFKTLTDPLTVPKWWGPERLTTAVHKMTVMPGGTWHYVQTDRDGKEYGFYGVYHEVHIPDRLVFTSEYEGMPRHVTLNIEELREENGKTIITMHTIFQHVEDRDQMLQLGMEEGVSEMTRRLNELLAKETIVDRRENIMAELDEKGECITITRLFDAPAERVWERWTDPDQFMCWWGPRDFTSPYARFDLQPGGKFLTSMRGLDGRDYWDTGHFEEIDPQRRLVYTDNFSDENGNIVPPSYYGMEGDQPIEMAVQINLEEVDGKTRLTLEHCGFPGGDMSAQAKEGWNQSLDKLAECLQ